MKLSPGEKLENIFNPKKAYIILTIFFLICLACFMLLYFIYSFWYFLLSI